MLLKSGKTNIKYLLIVVILVVVGGGGIWWLAQQEKFPTTTPFVPQTNCSLWYQNIETEFDNANFCEQNSDCKAIILGGSYVEFGCYKFVNISTNEEELLSKVEQYDKACAPAINRCALAPDAACINNKCVPDETADWQTYRNEEYGFEIKYPADFTEQEAESDVTLLAITKADSHYFVISVRKNYEVDQILSTIEEAKEINIGGHLGYEYFYVEGAGASEVALIQLGQNALSISFDYIGNGQKFATADDKKIYVQNFFNQILSTLKFTK